ncbi:hypothetical protein SAMN05444161_6678 [Rhizobiales bacterium GAS191]|nr:hypothetical protein SAMN05444161_6678 [Rhizobiales bacterium GAS191]
MVAAEVRQAPDGWHGVLRRDAIEHRVWLRDALREGVPYTAVLPLDRMFERRAHAARRLWRALNNRPAGPEFRPLPKQRRRRLIFSLRALDGKLEGAGYRAIAEGLFCADRIPERGWKTHDLRNRTIRLVHSGVALMRGGYRELLDYP